MPALKNLRHERFVREYLANGGYGARAYTAVYGRNGHTAETNASELLRKTELQHRIAELSRPAERKAKLDAAALLDEMADVLADAKRAEQHGTRVSAATLAARLQGMLIDRVEVNAGGFASCKSPSEVIDALLVDMSAPDLLDLFSRMSELVAARAATEATVVAPSRRRPDETSCALEARRPGKRF
jgi:hypothetical protein